MATVITKLKHGTAIVTANSTDGAVTLAEITGTSETVT